MSSIFRRENAGNSYSKDLATVLEGILTNDRLNHPIAEHIAPQAISWLNTYFTKSTHSFQLPELWRSWINYQVNSLHNNPSIIETRLPLRIQKASDN
jgi:hypothetical protein